MHDDHGTPTDLNLTLRGLLVAVVFVVLGAVALANPTQWSAIGESGQQTEVDQRPAPAPEPTDARQA